MTDMDKLKATLTEIGVPFEMTDDSEESREFETVDTVVVVKERKPDTSIPRVAYFGFRRDGRFKDFGIA